MDSLSRNVGIISRNNGALSTMLSQSPGQQDVAEPRQLRILLQDTGHLARETGEMLLSFQRDWSRESAPAREQVAFAKLSRDFQGVLHRFQQLAEQAAQHARCDGMELGSAPGVGSYASSSGVSYRAHDDNDDDADEQRTLLHATKRTDADALVERERIISQVESTVGEVKEIFSDLAQLVSEQSSHIQHISFAIENTATQAARATDELRTASSYQSRLRSRKCCMYVAALLGTFVLLLMAMQSLRPS
jgi:hypothetical protein